LVKQLSSPWKTPDWWVSYLNYEDDVRSSFSVPETVELLDLTLWDGEQQPGVVLRSGEKLAIAKLLDEVGVQRIGYNPLTSPEDKEATKQAAKERLKAKIFTFSRSMRADIDLALECDVDGIVMEIPSSEHMVEKGLGWSFEESVKRVAEATLYAHDHGLYVTLFTIDCTRAGKEWYHRMITELLNVGHMDSLTIADSFGACGPQGISHFVRTMKQITKKPIEIHCHNDFGLATANSVSAVSAGAEVVHATVNGISERSGSAALEEVVLALHALYGVRTGIRTERLVELSKLVQELSGIKLTPNKAIVGDNEFRLESGILVGWWTKFKSTGLPLGLFPYMWKYVGRHEPEIVIGKKSGRVSIIERGKQIGRSLPEDVADAILIKVKEFSEKKKGPLTDEEFRKIVSSVAPA
jgi:isopropylmalate/homocitrate/citramalate synthase